MPPPRYHPTPRRVQHGAAGHLQLLLLLLLRRRQQQLLLVVLVHVRHRLQQEELWYLLEQVAHHPPRRGGHGVVSAVTIVSVLVVGVVIVSAIFLRILGLYLLVLLGSHGMDGRRFGWKKGRLFVRLRAPYPARNSPHLILRKTDWEKEISSETGKGQNLPAAARKGRGDAVTRKSSTAKEKQRKRGIKKKSFPRKFSFELPLLSFLFLGRRRNESGRFSTPYPGQQEALLLLLLLRRGRSRRSILFLLFSCSSSPFT